MYFKRREAGIFPFCSDMFPLVLLMNYYELICNHFQIALYLVVKKVNETPEFSVHHHVS